MSWGHVSKIRDPGCSVTAATKIRPDEAEVLDALAGSLGLTRYELLRRWIRDGLSRATR